MHIHLCLSDEDGMLFNHRRQSRDRVLCERLLATLSQERPLYLSPYSAPLFSAFGHPLHISEHFLTEAGEGDVCFVEDRALLPHLARMETLTVYRWNRTYPTDTVCDLPWQDFTLLSREDFTGSSHERITKEIYSHG